MAIKKVTHRIQYEVDRLDGGINTSVAPSRVAISESPDCLNVIFDDRGAVETRQGTSYFNTSTSEVGGVNFDGLTVFNGTMVAWANGSMYRVSGTTLVTIPSAQCMFATGTAVAYEQYQNQLFMSDGSNGPYRYVTTGSFYNMGIAVPSAPVAAQTDSGVIAADTYHYAISFTNTEVFEGEIGSAFVSGATVTGSGTVIVSQIPIGSSLAGIVSRNVYRSTSLAGPFKYVGAVSGNVATTFTDTVAVGSEGGQAIEDGSAPTPFTTIKLHRERLFFDDSNNRTLLRYSEFGNPHISEALSFEPLNKGDGSNITAIGVQNSLVSIFKQNEIWVVDLLDPSDDTTWTYLKSPAKGGIVGARALEEWENGIIYVSKLNGGIVGFQYLSGIDVQNTTNNLLSTKNISEKIESDLLGWPSSLWSEIALKNYSNRIYCAVPDTELSSRIDALYWFDLTRLGSEQPGSWSPWSGVVGVNAFAIYNGVLYGVDTSASGKILRFNNATQTDADGSAIDSYWWSKQIGGEPAIESWIKDFRYVTTWHELSGAYDVSLRIRLDGDTGDGVIIPLSVSPGSSVWDGMVWDVDSWVGSLEKETQLSLGSNKTGRRMQVGFNNNGVVNQKFKVYSFKVLMNLRRER